jgi:hypothetical protein
LRHTSVASALEKLLRQSQHAPVDDSSRQLRHHPFMSNAVEVARQVDVDDAMLPPPQSLSHSLDGLVRRASRPSPKRALREVSLEDWFHNEPQRRLDHAISNCRN